jgi:hypothetical protein
MIGQSALQIALSSFQGQAHDARQAAGRSAVRRAARRHHGVRSIRADGIDARRRMSMDDDPR